MNPAPRAPGFSCPAGTFCDELFTFLADAGQSQYDESVTQLEHGLQTAALAEEAGAPEIEQVAALLHDIGHLLLDEHDGKKTFLRQDLRHEILGARYLSRWFGPAVGSPVALHVKAKRYLVATSPEYAESLSRASARSLELQGGPMTAEEAEQFLSLPYAQTAIALRRWDDAAKTRNAPVPDLEHWRPAVTRNMAIRPS
jgi:phosphonate degradation associated HDIG domain protein